MSAIPRSAEELFDPDAQQSDGTERIVDGPVRTADVRALKRKELSDKVAEFTDETDLREVLALPSGAGIRLLARIIGEPCGWNQPYFHPSNSVMSEIAGRRSIAYQLEQWISDADLELWFAVRRELERKRPKPKTSQSPK